MNGRRRLLKEYIRDDADEELDYLTIIPYSDGEPYVSRIAVYQPYMVVLTDGTEYLGDIWYSVDGGEWTLVNYGEYIDVPCFSKVRFKGNWHEVMKDIEFVENNIDSSYFPNFYSESSSDWWLLEGTPLSLIHGDNFKERKNDWNYGWDTFNGLFSISQNIGQINNPKTFLPSTELNVRCYVFMFAGSSICNAPELPAETLKEGCYYGMFTECTHLEEAPALNAKTLVPECYTGMFSSCVNLRYAKVTAKEGFYEGTTLNYMFFGIYHYGLAVLSQELIDNDFDYYFFEYNWVILTEDYPTNDEGYPEIKGDARDYNDACFNIEFKERYQANGIWYNVFLSGANESAKQLFDNFVSAFPNGEVVPVGGIFINRMPVLEFMRQDVEEDGKTVARIYFSFGLGGSAYYTGIINEDGSIFLERVGHLIYDYIKK